MTIEIRNPELEQLIEEQIRSGKFQDVNDFLTEALRALGKKNAPVAASRGERKDLARFLLESPFADSDLDLERKQDHGRAVDL